MIALFRQLWHRLRLSASLQKEGEGIEREIKFYDKTKALDLAGRHLGTFKDKLAVGFWNSGDGANEAG